MTDLILDSDWIYSRTGETYRLLHWETDFVVIRKVRGVEGLVGETFQISADRFRAGYIPPASKIIEV